MDPGHGRRKFEIHRWAEDRGLADTGEQLLAVDLTSRPARLVAGPATGSALGSNGALGADVIRLAAGDGFVPHTHPGDHILVVIGGLGTITWRGGVHPTRAGEVYFVEGPVAHAVGAITDHVLLAIGAPHQPIDSPYRMEPVSYEAVTGELGELHCLICDLVATRATRLHETGCAHCPCFDCHPHDGSRDSPR